MFRVLRHPDYRRLWTAQLVSQLGDWLGRMAVLGALAREDPAALGLYFASELALRLLPSAALGPLAGPLADRLPRRALMVSSDVLRAAVVVGMIGALQADSTDLLLALVALQMCLGTFFEAARAGAMPNTVPRDELHAAYTLGAATWSTMLAVGSGLSVVLMAAFGMTALFWIDAATYLVSALCLVGLRLPPVPEHPEPFRWRDVLVLEELRRAWRHLGERRARAAISAKWYWGVAGGFLVAIPLIAHERYAQRGEDFVAEAIGMLYMARGVGTGLGPLIARRLGQRDAALWRATGLAFVVAALGYGLVSGVHELWATCALVTLAHMGGSTIWVSATTLWQRRVDDAFRGRVHSLEFLGMTVAFAAAGFGVGLAHDGGVTVDPLLVVLAVAVLVSGRVWSARSRATLSTPIETPTAS